MRCKDVSWVHVVDKVTEAQVRIPVLQVSPCQDHSTDAQNSFNCTFFLPEGEMGESWEPPKKATLFWKWGGALDG